MSFPFNLREKISEIEASAYQHYRLRFNPFPMSGVAPEHPRIFASRSKTYERISDFIVRTYKSKKWAGLAIIAEYGNGKTHTLKLIRDQINEELGTTPEGKCSAFYIENLGESLRDLYLEFLGEVGFSLFVELLWNVLCRRFAKKLNDEYLSKLRPQQVALVTPPKNLAPFFISLSLFKTALDKSYLSREKTSVEIRNFLKEVVSNDNLLKCCVILVTETDDERNDLAWKYISGRSLTITQYKKIGLDKGSISDEDIGLELFSDILKIFTENSYTNIYLCLDEVEDIIPIPKQRKRELLGGLRRIIDNNQSNLAMIIATTMAGYVDLRASSPPLADRFPVLVELSPLNPSETRELILQYLSMARVTPEEENIYPFTEKLLEEIWKRTGGNVRKVLEACYRLLQAGVSQKAKVLDLSLLET